VRVTGGPVSTEVAAIAASLVLVVALAACTAGSGGATPPGATGPDDAPTDTPAHEVGAPSLHDLGAEIVPGSRVRLAWRSEHAASIDVFALHDDASEAPLSLVEGLAGGVAEVVVPIPVRSRQTLLVVARAAPGAPAGDASATVVPRGVVTSESDHDERGGAAPVSGSLRAVVQAAEPGAVVGFAADVRSIDLVGFDGAGTERAHLELGGATPAGRITISGPAWDGDEAPHVAVRSAQHLRFVERAGVVAIASGADVVLENVTVAGGGFTERGGGIRNHGTLSLIDSVVEGNRAWAWGGGIYNGGGVLTLTRVVVRDNVAAVSSDEPDGVPTDVDGQPGFIAFCAPVPGAACEPVVISAAAGAGGGLQNVDGDVSIVDSVFARNHARFSGGGMCNIGGHALIVGTDFLHNDASSEPYPGFEFPNRGGGVYSTRSGSVEIRGGRFVGNTVDEGDGWGGGVSLRYSATLHMHDVEVTANRASLGGGVFTETASGAGANYVLSGVVYLGNVASHEGDDRFHWDIEP